MIAYLNGDFLPVEKITISPDDRGFQFADGLYEAMRAYGGVLFRADEHLDRLAYGARQLQFARHDFTTVKSIFVELLRRNSLENKDALIYMQVTRGVAERTHAFPPADTPLTIYIRVKFFSGWPDELQNGIKVISVPDKRWSQCHLKTTGLLANILAHQQARESGAAEAIFIRDGFITEGSHSNVFVVKDKKLITPPLSDYLLAGITRQAVLEIASGLKIDVREVAIPASDLEDADEVFITGTTVEITPVVHVNGKNVRHGRPGELTIQLQKEFNLLK